MKGYPSNKGTLNKSWVVEDESPTWFGKSDLFTPLGVQFPSPSSQFNSGVFTGSFSPTLADS